MIEYLAGRVLQRLPTGVILDVNGVGYGLTLPLPTIAALPAEGGPLSLWVYTRVREDALQLYGFLAREERLTFEILIGVNGVGPKVAIAILSTLGVAGLREAVEERAIEVLNSVPGIGKRTAEKILVELHARLERLPMAPLQSKVVPRAGAGLLPFAEESARRWQAPLQGDLKSALENLGFKDKDISPLITKLRDEYAGEDFAELVRKALALLAKHQVGAKAAPSRRAKRGEPDLDAIF